MSTCEPILRTVSECMDPRPLTVVRGTACTVLIARMTAQNKDCAVVVDGAGSPLGIVTSADLLRRLAYPAAPQTPAERVMSAPLTTLAADERLFHGIARMRRAQITHLPVLDAAGRVAGVLRLADALAAACPEVFGRIERLSHEASPEALAALRHTQAEVTLELLDEDRPAHEIQALLTALNNDVYRRLAARVRASLREDGWGEAPVEFAVIVMGSGGRGENHLHPDQDNGLILDDYPDAEHGAADGFFAEFGARLAASLDAAGFSRCRGAVMADNPLWRKSLSQWVAQVEGWARNRGTVAVRLADIFYDFRPVFGAHALADALRARVAPVVAGSPLYLQAMLEDQAAHPAGVGPFGLLATEHHAADHPGELNLKLAGVLPLVSAVRLLALRFGIAATGTRERLARLAATGALDDDTRAAALAALDLLSGLLLRRQASDCLAGRAVSSFVSPQGLRREEREGLVTALRAVEALRAEVRSRLTGAVF